MIPRINKLEALDNLLLKVTFDDGKAVIYDVKEDINDIPSYKVLETEIGLFKNVQLDKSRTCVYSVSYTHLDVYKRQVSALGYSLAALFL